MSAVQVVQSPERKAGASRQMDRQIRFPERRRAHRRSLQRSSRPRYPGSVAGGAHLHRGESRGRAPAGGLDSTRQRLIRTAVHRVGPCQAFAAPRLGGASPRLRYGPRQTATTTTTRRPRRWFRFGHRDGLAGYLFIAPSILSLAVFVILPVLGVLYYSFSGYDLMSAPEFEGFENYVDLPSDTRYPRAAFNTLFYAFGTVPTGTIISLLPALLPGAHLPGLSGLQVARTPRFAGDRDHAGDGVGGAGQEGAELGRFTG